MTRRQVVFLPNHDRLFIGVVYLLHFSRPYRHARHYVGFTTDIKRRLSQHRRGVTSPLVRCAVADGIEIFLARVWGEVNVHFEKWLHTRPKPTLCPICCGPRAFRRGNVIRHPVTGIGQ